MAGENVAKLVVQIDATQARAAQAQLERDFGATVGRMDERSRAIDRSVATWGTSMQRTAQLGQRAMQGMVGAMNAVGAAQAAQEKSWLSLGAMLLSSFAAGGPIMAALTAVGAVIGTVAGSSNRASAEAAKNAEEAKQRVRDLRRELEALNREDSAKALGVGTDTLGGVLDKARELASARADLAKAQADAAVLEKKQAENGYLFYQSDVDALRSYTEQIDTLRLKIATLEPLLTKFQRAMGREQTYSSLARFEEMQGLRDRNAVMAAGLGGGFNRTNEMQIEQGIASMRRAIEAARVVNDRDEVGRLQEKLGLEEDRLAIQRQLNDLAISRIDRGLAREVELLHARNDQERELIRLRHRSQDLLESGASPVAVSALEAATRAAAARRPWDDLLRSADQTLGQGLTDLIYDGIVNGFENASDIAETIWQTLLRQLINQFVTSGIQGLLSGLGGGGGGGLFGVFGSLLGGGGGGGGGSFLSGSGSSGLLGIGGGGSLDGINAAGEVFTGGGLIERAGLAEGGIATRPTLRVFGERGPEAVVPLHKMQQMGGGGVSVNMNLSVGGGAGGDYEAIRGRILSDVARALDENSAFRNAIKRQARGGL